MIGLSLSYRFDWVGRLVISDLSDLIDEHVGRDLRQLATCIGLFACCLILSLVLSQFTCILLHPHRTLVVETDLAFDAKVLL